MHEALSYDPVDRRLVVKNSVAKDTLLMQLPLKGTVIQQRPDNALSVKLMEELEQQRSATFAVESPKDREDLFKEHTKDVLLAAYLASNPPDQAIRPYLDSLPTDVSSFPVHWSLPAIQRRLQGSPLQDRVIALQKQHEQDYACVRRVYGQEAPSKEGFLYALSMVESRAFGFDETVDGPIMVPLLDLCNHVRGQQSNQKTASYRINSSLRDAICVTSTQDLAANTEVCITYGARSNGQLLLKYGFCLNSNTNLEPDGSSNDLLECKFAVGSNTKTVVLRTGPKQYTFGPLTQAVEECYCYETKGGLQMDSLNDDEIENGDCNDDVDDMDAFLQACEEEGEENDENDADVFYEDMGVNDNSEVEDNVSIELAALYQLESRLNKRVEAYDPKHRSRSWKEWNELATMPSSSDTYAAILMHSELRILRFYLIAVSKLQTKLSSGDASVSTRMFDDVIHLSAEDTKRVDSQTTELADVYMQIRHSCT